MSQPLAYESATGARRRVTVHSILFAGDGLPGEIEQAREPAHFADLNLDQVVASVTADRAEYALTPFFHWPLSEPEAVSYRQEVFQDLEQRDVHELVAAFAQRTLVAKFGYVTREMERDTPDFGHYHRARAFLNAADGYCAAVSALAAGLAEVTVHSRGLLGLRGYLERHVGSPAFSELQAETRRLEDALRAVSYCILVKGSRVTVGRHSDQLDYSEQVTRTFARFAQGAATDYRDVRPGWKEEEFAAIGVLHLVSKLYPDLFAALDSFCAQHAGYLDPTVALADREFQFYLSYLDHIRPLRQAGLSFSYPRMSVDSKDEQALDTFDLALATKLVKQADQVVCNDISLTGPERILVISGPNNGGKTTLARTVGQLHYLARLGCPVPGRDLRLFLCDQIFTHFEKEEDITTLAGKLQDELNRLRADLDRATPASVVILNEVFSSTTAQDAQFLSRKILKRLFELDALGVCVTFLEDLSTLSEKTVSMVSQVVADDPATRTHKVIRVAADGRAYARALAQKYGLTYEQITVGRATP
ncbi:MAG: MutS-related protein [Solirubrobacteraceae bacterium]